MNDQPASQRTPRWQPAPAPPDFWPAAPPAAGPTGSATASRAILDRERGRIRLRAVTVTAGLAGLVAAGVIAYDLPGPAHSSTSGNQATAGSGGPVAGAGSAASGGSSRSRRSGDDGEASATGSGGTAVRPAGSGGTTSHAASGGS